MNNDDLVRVENACKIILPRFRNIAKDIWGESIDNIVFKCEHKIAKEKNLASLSRDARCVPYAIGNHLFRYCKEYTLQLTPRFLDLNDAHKERILRHEALHIGYSRHTTDFMETALKAKAPFSESSIDKNEIIIEAKGTKGRYEKVLTVPVPEDTKFFSLTLDKARQLGKQYALEHKKDVRISF